MLLRTDTARFLLTARHVVEGYRGKLVAALGAPNGQNPTDITHWRIIDESRALDVATIEVPRGFDERSIGKVSLRATIPLARAQQGDSVTFFGFPGLHRRHETEPRGVRLALDGFSDFVVSASERGFVIADERGERQVFEYVEGLPPLGPTGGVSGAGVFVRRGDALALCGVVYEGSPGTDAWFWAAHADFLRADGTLDHTRIPPGR